MGCSTHVKNSEAASSTAKRHSCAGRNIRGNSQNRSSRRKGGAASNRELAKDVVDTTWLRVEEARSVTIK